MTYVTEVAPERRGYPGNKTIRKMALEHMRNHDKTTVRRMAKEETLDAYLASIVTEVKNHGEKLMGEGVMPSEAWRRAIRVHIMGMADE